MKESCHIDIGLQQVQKIETDMVSNIMRICKQNNIECYMVAGSALGTIRHGGPIPWDSDVDIGVPWSQLNKLKEVFKKEINDLYSLDYYPKNPNYHLFFPRVTLKNVDSYILHVDIFPFVGLPVDYKAQIAYSKISDRLCQRFDRKQLFGYPWDGRLKRFLRRIRSFIILQSAKKLYFLFDKHCREYDYFTSKYVMNPCGHYSIKNIIPHSILGSGTELPYMGINVTVPEKYHEYLQHYYNDYMRLPSENEQHRWDDLVISIPVLIYNKLQEEHII